MKVPRFEDHLCITDDARTAAEISSLFRRRKCYFPVLDAPRIARPDRSAEVIRRNNAIVRSGVRKIIYASLDDATISAMGKQIPQDLTTVAHTTQQFIESCSISVPPSILEWGPDNLGIGLLTAKRHRQRLSIALPKSPSQERLSGTSGLMVVVEGGKSLANIVAANLAYSTDAAFHVIPEIPKDTTETINESLAQVYESTGVPVGTKIELLRDMLRTLAPNLEVTGASWVVYFTAGLPWGFAFPDTPATHILSYPDVGLSVSNAVASEQAEQPGIRIALVIDPNEGENPEIDIACKELVNRHAIVRVLRGKSATVRNAQLQVAAMPYDFLLISTHAGEIPGRRLHYQFTDSEGNKRALVVDQAVGFAREPGQAIQRRFERAVSRPCAFLSFWTEMDSPVSVDSSVRKLTV